MKELKYLVDLIDMLTQASNDDNGLGISPKTADRLLDEAIALHNAILKLITDETVLPSLQSVLDERARQDQKWGEQNHDPFTYMAILMEEVGEFSQVCLSHRFGSRNESKEARMREELVQVAAVALAMVECLDRKKWEWPNTTDPNGDKY